MSAAFLCARAGIAPVLIENQAAYLAGWLRTIKQDKKLIVAAASAAQKATDWILDEQPDPAP
jgi:antirestriction protein ArdC